MKIRNLGHDKLGLSFSMAIAVSLVLLTGSISSAYAHNTTPNANATYRDQAKRMHERLVGTPPTENALNVMANYIDPAVDGSGGGSPSADLSGAAMYAMTPADPATDDPGTSQYERL